ncbi:acyl-CoA thioesterase 9 [Plakobranchus ocellatus]|uniref:Acyl-CoA thioesterase 9 n=1 Tax=Plakobranchus ocellatus TaxID=259542 RepID=A0AAV3Z205_9GAST|nr:acyl-CoA thioesterase 9 [Plakobranchus ocellatus]
MKDTAPQSVVNCHPEDGSVYNKIFGGFVLMKAFELVSTTASIFCRGCPGVSRSIDDMLFFKPVEIGDVVHLAPTVSSSRTTYRIQKKKKRGRSSEFLEKVADNKARYLVFNRLKSMKLNLKQD